MPDDEISAKVAELERRMTRLEREVFSFQMGAAKKLTEALAIIQGHEKARDVQVQETLVKMTEELAEIKKRLGQVVGPPISH